MRILVVANLYPSRTHPAFGTFVKTRVEALRGAGEEVTVVAITDAQVHRNVARKYLRLALEAARTAATARLHGTRFEIVECHIAFPTGLVGWLVAPIGGSNLVLFAHGSDVTTIPTRTRLHRWLARMLFRRADLIVANSHFTAARARAIASLRRPPLIAPPGILLRPSVVDDPSRRVGVAFVGRLVPGKGVELLIEAAARVRDRLNEEVVIVGDGTERHALEALARRLQADVRFCGSLPPEGVADVLDRAAVVAVPSVQAEGLGLVALEAMASGAIVVATTVGGLSEIVRDGETAIVVEPGDVDGLATALVRARELSTAPEGEAMRTRARSTAAEHDPTRLARETLDAYAALVSAVA
jgi:teichuronic acid biosynthesis glycosyltransferase TuaC